MQRLDEVGIATRDQLVEQFDHRHLRPERVVDGRHLEADDPAADHEQPLGYRRQFHAPVEEKMRWSSGIAGIEAASEPAAMMQLSN